MLVASAFCAYLGLTISTVVRLRRRATRDEVEPLTEFVEEDEDEVESSLEKKV